MYLHTLELVGFRPYGDGHNRKTAFEEAETRAVQQEPYLKPGSPEIVLHRAAHAETGRIISGDCWKFGKGDAVTTRWVAVYRADPVERLALSRTEGGRP